MSDLFSDIEKDALLNLAPSLTNWFDYFTYDERITIEHCLRTVDNEIDSGVIVYPEFENIFKMWGLLSPKDVKVMIIGQDPYSDGNATGVAFECAKEVSASLRVLHGAWEAVSDSYGNLTKSLSYLTKQGVFLANNSLTVELGRPGSHEWIDWKKVIKATIRVIHIQNTKPAYILLGSAAKENYANLLIGLKVAVFADDHPAYFARKNVAMPSATFSAANWHLINSKQKPIDWLDTFNN